MTYRPMFFSGRSYCFALYLIYSLLVLTAQTQAQSGATPVIRYVSTTGTNSNPATATSWATSTTNLQGAINASASGDQVWVARGLYKPGGNANTDRYSSFSMKVGVGLSGGYVGIETVASQRPPINFSNPSSTTLSGEIGNPNSTTDNSYHVIKNPSGLTPNGALEGFVITGGRADNPFYPDNCGGGMFSSASDNGVTYGPLIVNCLFQNNYAVLGGAMYNSGNFGGSSTPRFFTCEFKNNSASKGGAIYNEVATPTFFNCAFYNNAATGSGGAIYTQDASPVFTNCSFQLNYVSTGNGFAIHNNKTYVNASLNPSLTNCVLFSNGGSGTFYNTGTGATVLANYNLFYYATVGYTGANNLTTVDSPFASVNDSRLWSGSPAINAGNPATTAATVGTVDLAGNPRFYNGGRVDMGAFEYQGAFCLPVSVTAQSATSVLACVGTTVTSTVSVSGSVTGYQWYKGTTAITGQTSATLTLANVQPTSAGSYAVVVTSDCNSMTSTAVNLTISTVSPTRLYVRSNATGANTGLSWADAFTDLQSALRYTGCTTSLTEIWVANGAYKPTNTTNRTISFSMLPNVAIYGGFLGTETLLSQRPAITITTPSGTTLSGDIGTPNSTSDNSYHVISNKSGLTNTAILDGFVITGGNANGTTTDDNAGGGMLNKVVDNNTLCSPLLRNCLFSGNIGYAYGGALYNSSSFGATSSPKLISCIFQNNSNSYGSGGAIYNESISGGIPLRSGISNPQFVNCLFLNNSTQFYGGAIYNYSTSNYSTSISGKSSSSPQLINCSFQSNSAPFQSGGALYNNAINGGNSSPELINCSFQNNTASSQGGAIYSNSDGGTCTVGLTNCAFYNNGQAKTFYNQSTTVLARYSLFEPAVTGYTSVTGNVTTTTSPFVSNTSTQLWSGSPAINIGDPATTSATVGTTDLAGSARFYTNGRIDAGAFEYQGLFCLPVTVAGVSAINNLFASSMTVCQGETAGAIVARSGLVQSIQWYKGTTLLSGQTSATLTLTNVQPADAGSYSCVVTSSCNSVTSPAFSLVVNVGPTRLYVRANAAGANTGLSWADAFTDLQSALRYTGCTNSLTEIWVANGTYKPTTTTGPASRTISFSMRPGIAIYGGFAGTETTLNQRTLTYPSGTILSGDIGSPNSTTDNTYHVISNNGDLTNSAILDGFVISGGNADFANNPEPYGGGLSNKATGSGSVCSPKIRNCLFQGNTAFYGGGGIFNKSLDGGISSPQFINCAFQNNTATYLTGSGGAIYNATYIGSISSPQFINCSFQANFAMNSGWAISNNIFHGNSTISLTNCVLFNNGGASTIFNATPVDGFSATVSARYSLFDQSVTGYTSVTGNLTATTSPFATTTSTQLQSGSPAINAGDLAVSSATIGTIDLAGNPRFYNNGRIDMGAFEYQGGLCTGMMATVKAGLWNDPTVWSCGVLPTGSDIVQINHNVTIPAGFVAYGLRLQYQAGGRLIWTTGSRLLMGL